MCRTGDLSQYVPFRTSPMTSERPAHLGFQTIGKSVEYISARFSQGLFKLVTMQQGAIDTVAVHRNDISSHSPDEKVCSPETVTLVALPTGPLNHTPLQQIIWSELEIFR